MKKEKLSEEIGKIDNDIIEEADKVRMAHADDPPVRKKSPILIATSVLVAAAAAITGVVVIPRLGNNNVPVSDEIPTTDTAVVTQAPDVHVGAGETDIHSGGFTRERRKSAIVSDVSAVSSAGDFISENSALRLTTAAGVTEDMLKERVRLSNDSTFTLTRESDTSYLLRTDVSFAKGSLVNLTVTDEDGDTADSWAFRTADKFVVTSTYPADGATGVRADAGIELYLTEENDISRIDDYFVIEPHVDGEFEEFMGNLYFQPNDPLEANTVYTVTLKAGHPSKSGDVLEEDCSFSFRTTSFGADGTYMFTKSSSSGFSESFLTSDRACIEISCSENLRNTPFTTHLYQFADASAYHDAIKAKTESKWAEECVIDTSGLTEVFKSGEKPFWREGNNQSVYILLPEDLEKGYYIADVAADIEGAPGLSLQYLIQVSDISVYALGLGEENIFLVNDSATGKPVAGATAALEIGSAKYTATTDERGIAYIKTGGETGKAVLNVTSSAGSFTDSYLLSYAEDVKYEDEYYMYLYTDRAAYLPTDTVDVWGVIVPKRRGKTLPSDLHLTFENNDYPVSINSRGTFSTTVSFTNHATHWGNRIYLKSGEDELTSTSFIILEYTKPTYILDIDAPEYIVMPQVNPVDITASVTYFEGTPAQNVLIKSSSDDLVLADGVLQTDANGEAKTTFTYKDPPSWINSVNFGISLEVTGIEDTYVYGYKAVPVLYHDRLLEYSYDKDANSYTITTSALDLSRAADFFAMVKNDDGYYHGGDFDVIKSGPVDVPVHLVITRNWSEKHETGSYYDYLEKRTVKTYEYEYMNEVVLDTTVTTSNGTYTFTDLPVDKEGSYDFDMTMKDSKGYVMEATDWPIQDNEYFYLSGDSMAYRKSSGTLMFRLDAKEAGAEKTEDPTGYFTDNGEVEFSLECSNGQKEFDGRLLLTVWKNDILTYDVYDLNGTNTVTYRTSLDCIPNASYAAAYFDGTHIYNVSGSTIYYRPDERDLKIETETDAKTYDAGDTAELSVKVTDKSGAAISGATVLLSVVDEAAFAVADQEADTLHAIYRHIWFPNAVSYVSYIQHLSSDKMYGEKGGGGGEGVRKDFKDTAFFAEAVTANDGTASFDVKLPDNMTTWRATVLAVYDTFDGKMLAGASRTPIVVTRPVFITPIMQSSFVEGDDIAVSARCAGLPADGTVTVEISGGDVNETRTIKQLETANFGKLAKGSYTVRFTAESGGYKDVMERELTVTDTLLETDIVKGVGLMDIADTVKPSKWPLHAAFFDKRYMLNTDILIDLSYYGGSNLGMRLAAAYSQLALGYITEEEFTAMFAPETENDFAKPLPAANPDQYLTAMLAILAPDSIGSECKRLLEKYTDNETYSETEVCVSYMALAGLGEPVMHSVKKLLTDNPDMSAVNGIRLSAALALCGDYKAAYDAYMSFVPEITINDADPNAVFAYIADKDGNADFDLTKNALITASVLGLDESVYFARYLFNDGSAEKAHFGCAPELAIYLDRYVPDNGTPAVFTYSDGGTTKTVMLDKHRPTFITFDENALRSADFNVQSGDVYAIVSYVGRIGENSEAPSLAVAKSLSGTAALGEEMTVTITASPNSIVYDVVPSCGRLTGSDSERLITLFTDNNGHASYTFTVNTAGSFVVESAAVYDYLNGKWGMSNRATVTTGSDYGA